MFNLTSIYLSLYWCGLNVHLKCLCVENLNPKSANVFGGGDFGRLLVSPGLMKLSPPDGIKWFYTKERPELSHSVFVASELLVCN